MQNADGTWTYVTTRRFTDTWGYIANPWNDNKPAWFRFDVNGKMLTGWQMINWNGSYKFFYFREAADGRRGECLIDGVTPDGYTVNKDGAWTVDGIVQEYVPAAASGSTGSGPASALPASNAVGGIGTVTISSSLSADALEVAVPGEGRAILIKKASLKQVQGTGTGLMEELGKVNGGTPEPPGFNQIYCNYCDITYSSKDGLRCPNCNRVSVFVNPAHPASSTKVD